MGIREEIFNDKILEIELNIQALSNDIEINGRFSYKQEKDGSISGTIDKQEKVNELMQLKLSIQEALTNQG
jgi:hypothetical protein